jgi:predicted dehydrogenase
MAAMDTIKAVLAGCGGISGAWLKSFPGIQGLEIVGLVDIREEAARKRRDEFGIKDARIGTDLRAMLEATRPDVVFDCTVPESHRSVVLTALELGCHVLGEKPLADTLEHALEMVGAAGRSGKTYAVIQNRRYDARIRRLKSFLRSGGLGRLTTLNSDFYLGAHFGGFRDKMEHVLVLDMAIHTFDAARLISGADPVSVYCKEWNPAGSWYDHAASAICIFEMTDGLVYCYRGSWCSEGLNTTWECDWRVIGEGGSVSWDGADGFRAEVVAKTGGFKSEMRAAEVPPASEPGKEGGHAGQIADFVRCVRSGETPETVCTDNIKSIAMVFAAIESSTTGRTVKVTYR